MTQHYELMFMLPGSIDETSVPASKERLLGMVSQHGGTITSQYDMGRRKLAYQIGQQNFGHYHLAQFDMETDPLADLDAKLRLDNELMRYILVKARAMNEEELKKMIEIDEEEQKPEATDDVAGALPVQKPVQKETEKAKPKPAAPAPVAKPAQPIKETAIPETPLEMPAAPATEKKAESTEEPITLEELDKKLDAILEDTDLESKL